MAGLALGLVVLIAIPPAMSEEYTIGPGDVLDISVLGEWNAPAPVNPEGKIVIPLVGEMAVTGLTLAQVTEKVKTELKQFIRDPQVMISIRQTGPRRQFVYLLGQVLHPGAYEMQKEWTIAELLAVAGGPTPGAALPRAIILRKSTTIPVDLKQLLVDGTASANVTLDPGDVVIVPETKNRVVLMGAVTKPGAYVFTPGDRVVDIMSAAGGPTPKAVIGNIGVIRQSGGKPAVTPIDLSKFYKDGDLRQNIVLQADDIVYVPEQSGFDFGSFLSSINGLAYIFLLLR